MKDNDSDRIKLIIKLLDGVLKGDISADVALKNWPDIYSEKNGTIKRCWHALSHYADDEDIRSRDESYGLYQRNHLLKYIKRLQKMTEGKQSLLERLCTLFGERKN